MIDGEPIDPTNLEQTYVYRAYVERVIDGDTIDVSVDLGFKIHSIQRLRLQGLNAPEIRGEEREAGLAARKFVAERLKETDVVWIKTTKSKTYGEYDAQVWYGKGEDWININHRLIGEGHAKKTWE